MTEIISDEMAARLEYVEALANGVGGLDDLIEACERAGLESVDDFRLTDKGRAALAAYRAAKAGGDAGKADKPVIVDGVDEYITAAGNSCKRVAGRTFRHNYRGMHIGPVGNRFIQEVNHPLIAHNPDGSIADGRAGDPFWDKLRIIGPRPSDKAAPADPKVSKSTPLQPTDDAAQSVAPSNSVTAMTLNEPPRPAGLSPEMPWPVVPGWYRTLGNNKAWIAGMDHTGNNFIGYYDDDTMSEWWAIKDMSAPWTERTFTRVNIWMEHPERGVEYYSAKDEAHADEIINQQQFRHDTKLLARQTVTLTEGEGV